MVGTSTTTEGSKGEAGPSASPKGSEPLGGGGPLSVLLFFSVLLIAWLLVKAFKVDLASARGEG